MTSCLFSFGVIADLHYMDAENGLNFDGSKVRRFRGSLKMLMKASDTFRESKTKFNMMMGDLIDGKARSSGKQLEFLDEILDKTLRSDQLWFSTLGNHEFYNFTREEMNSRLIHPMNKETCSPTGLYYSFSVFEGYKCIVLDGYEMSTMGGVSPEVMRKSHELICSHNHNYAAGSSDWFHDLPLEERRYVPFNGGVLEGQMAWLTDELRSAANRNEKCFVFCHMPLIAAASRENNLLWNCEEVLRILHSTPSGTVLACFAGHDHNGGYAVDAHGIHHIVPPSPIEVEENEDTFGSIEVYPGKLKIIWTGVRPAPEANWPDELPIPVATTHCPN